MRLATVILDLGGFSWSAISPEVLFCCAIHAMGQKGLYCLGDQKVRLDTGSPSLGQNIRTYDTRPVRRSQQKKRGANDIAIRQRRSIFGEARLLGNRAEQDNGCGAQRVFSIFWAES